MVIMHQNVLLSFASKFGYISKEKVPDDETTGDLPDEFEGDLGVHGNDHNLDDDSSDGDADYEDYQFLPPSSSQNQLSDAQFSYLQEHYGAQFSNPEDDERLEPGDRYGSVSHLERGLERRFFRTERVTKLQANLTPSIRGHVVEVPKRKSEKRSLMAVIYIQSDEGTEDCFPQTI
jgi:hypothetical protein